MDGDIPPAEPIDYAPEDIPLDFLFEDRDLAVINKAAGMVVHPAPGNYTGTLVNPFCAAAADLANDEIDLTARVPGIMGDGIALAATSPGANDITAGGASLGVVASATRGSGSERAFILAIDTDGLQPNAAILSVIDQYRNESTAQA